MTDKADDIRRRLGLRSRRTAPPAAAPAPSSSAEPATPAPATPADASTDAPYDPLGYDESGSMVAAAGPATEAPPTPPPAPAPPPRSTAAERRAVSASSRRGAEPEPPTEPPPVPPALKPVGRLPKEAQMILRNWYAQRKDVDLPAYLHKLEGTWGRYYGDGRPARLLVIGWQPAFVLFTMPTYPDKQPTWEKGEFIMPGLPEQPELSKIGFVVQPHLNELGKTYIYIVWKSDGTEPPAKPTIPTVEAKPVKPQRRSPREAREALDRRQGRPSSRRPPS
jgi:hypothetical protein